MARLFVRAVADARHRASALEAAAHGIVDTVRAAPARLDRLVAVAVVARKLLGAFLHNRDLVNRRWHLWRC